MGKISTLPQDSAPSSDDYIVVNDSTSGQTKKVLLSDLYTYLLSTTNSGSGINSGAIDWTTAGNIWYQEIGRSTLSGAADLLNITGLPTKKYLRVMVHLIASGSLTTSMRLNNDSGNNYSHTYEVDRAWSSSGGAANAISAFEGAAYDTYTTIDIINVASKVKFLHVTVVGGNSTTATVPRYVEFYAKWTNTTDAISRIDFINGGAGDYAAGSQVVVLGHD